jgi:hypothetical protein
VKVYKELASTSNELLHAQVGKFTQLSSHV